VRGRAAYAKKRPLLCGHKVHGGWKGHHSGEAGVRATRCSGRKAGSETRAECRRMAGMALGGEGTIDNGLPDAADLVLKAPFMAAPASAPALSVAMASSETPANAPALSVAMASSETQSSVGSRASAALSIIFPSGEPCVSSVRFDPDDTPSALMRQLQQYISSNFKLLSHDGEILSETDENRRLRDLGVQDGSVLTAVIGQMTLGCRNRVSKLQRLERDVKRFQTLHEDQELWPRAAKSMFARFKGSDDVDLQQRLGTDLVYRIGARKFANEIRSRSGLKELVYSEVEEMMLEAMVTGNGGLNKQDFGLFYRRVIADALAELEVHLRNERSGAQSDEAWLRNQLQMCAKEYIWVQHYSGLRYDYPYVGCLSTWVTTLRLWKADACYQELTIYFDAPGRYVAVTLIDGTFEIRGEELMLNCGKRVDCIRQDPVRPEALLNQPANRNLWYQPRRLRQVVADAEAQRATPGPWRRKDADRVTAEKFPIARLSSKSPEAWCMPDKSVLNHVQVAMRLHEFSHADSGTRGLQEFWSK